MGRRRHGVLLAAMAAAWATPAEAQRTGENAVTVAEDAFGTSVGRETIGLYNSGNVRGFSANAAGNARIEGLYFDPVWQPNARMRRSLTIRVGLSAQGYLFPAPTGIVDYALRRPGNTPSGSFYASADSYGSLAVELDAVLPVTDTLSIAGGGGLYRNSFYNDTEGKQHIQGVTALWTPAPAIEIQPFWGRSDIYDDEFGPHFVPVGPFLPPRVPRRRFLGPQQPKFRSTAVIYGGLGSFELGDGWRLRAGLFRTFFDDPLTGANLMLDLQPDGSARQLFIVDAPSRLASTSGELRLTRRLAEGPRLHAVHLSLRGRDRRKRFDGAALIDLGPTGIDRPVPPLGPAFAFSEQSVDEVRQWTAGIAYEGRWRNVGELNLGLQRSDYGKRIARPGLPVVATDSNPWLYSVAAAAHLSDRLAVYAGYTRGLEESGVAPSSAANRNEPLPAILTSQRDAGFRWTIGPNLRLVAGLFDVRKPYFERDAGNLYSLLGEVRHRGIEASLTGALTPRLNIVAGAVLMRPRVTGEGVELGRVGRRPVGQPTRLIRFNADWRPPQLPGLSFDLGVVHTGRRPATRDNLVSLPARTLIDVGGRYAFRLGGRAASLRLSVTNLADVYGFDLRGSGAYDLIPGRVATLSLAVDF